MSKSITVTVRIPENLFNQIDLLAGDISPFRPNLSQAILHLLSLGLQSPALNSKQPPCFSQDHIHIVKQ
jgi:hypothetical protein